MSLFSCKSDDDDDSPTYYTITISSTIENGSVEASKKSASFGESIKLTAKPATGYELDSYSVTDSKGSAITVTNGEFKMPASSVTISATFKETTETVNQKAAAAVIAKINAIGTVAYTDACKELIDDARSAYDALTNDQKVLVTNYSTLTTAESSYSELKTAADNQAAAADVIAKINAIGTVAYSDKSKTKIDAARSAYDALTSDQKTLVTNYSTLTTAESSYSELKTAADNQAAAADVIAKINAIGTVAYTDACKELIDDARTAYDALTSDQKVLVTNYSTLTTAESSYSELKTAADNQAAAADVIAKINAIGTVAYTDACKELIDDARNAYDALTSDQKVLVTNYETLTTAESTYRSLTPVSSNGSGFSVTTWENEPGDNLGTE